MKTQIYQVVHIVSMILLTAFIFQAFANPDPKNKKRTMMITGILSLLMLIGGFGLLAVMKLGFPIWIIVKVVCWLGLSAMAGFAYRKPDKIPALTGVTIILILVAVSTVYFRHGAATKFE